MTQLQVAELVGVSQQTVARWEKSSSAIPSRHLQDLALALGCRIDDLIETKPALASRGAFVRSLSDEDRPFGTARVHLTEARRGIKVLEYPVSVAEAGRLRHRLDPDVMTSWLDFWTMDDRVVLIRSGAVAIVELMDDDIEAMPGYENPEVYEALLDERMQELLGTDTLPPAITDENFPFSRTLIEHCRSDTAWWRRFGAFDDRADPAHRVVADFTAGDRRVLDYCADETFGELQRLVEYLDDVRLADADASCLEHWMLDLRPDGDVQAMFVRLGALHSIQFSRVGYERAVSQLFDVG